MIIQYRKHSNDPIEDTIIISAEKLWAIIIDYIKQGNRFKSKYKCRIYHSSFHNYILDGSHMLRNKRCIEVL